MYCCDVILLLVVLYSAFLLDAKKPIANSTCCIKILAAAYS